MAENITNEDCLNLIIIYGECNRNISRTCRTFNERYPNSPRANRNMLRKLLENCLNNGSFKSKREKEHSVIKEDNEIMVLAYFNANSTASLREAERDLGLCKSSIHKILLKNKWHPFKYTQVQHLRDTDPERRVAFCEWMLTKIEENQNFTKNIIWTDEAKFMKNGLYNRHNSHFWSEENPHVVRESNFQDLWKFNVFCGIKNDSVIWYHFYNENLNGERYVEILNNVVGPVVRNMPEREALTAFYQMDGAPPHNTRIVGETLDQMFEDRWIANNGPFLWPPRSPDLNPLDFFVWGYIKNKVYSDPVTTKDNMIDRIRRAFQSITPEMIKKATQSNLMKRIQKCLEVNGNVFEHILK